MNSRRLGSEGVTLGYDGAEPFRLGFKCPNSSAGFSLIELIGVVAVIAIAAALIAPSIIRRIDIAAKIKEGNDLLAISNSLALNILRTKTIPSAAPGGTNWARFVADWTRTTSNQVAVNPRRNMRHMLFDGGGWLTNTLPYVQRTNGTANAPANARAIILTSIGRTLTGQIGGSFTLAAGEFSILWNTPDGQKPSTGVVAAWTGRPEDLVIQRISFDPLFYHLALVNRDPPGNARFAIDSTNSLALTNVYRSFYLSGTDVGLYDGAGNAQRRVALTQDESFVFQAGRWAGNVDPDNTFSDVQGNEFAALAAQFLAAPWYDDAHKGGNQQGAVLGMFNFMLTFQLWANKCPHFLAYTGNPQDVPEYLLMEAFAGNGASSLLNSFTGTDGLLKKP